MPPNTQILPINPCTSDGDVSRWPAADKGLSRNDTYLLERLAASWAKDQFGGPAPGFTYKLDRLPDGYGGFEKGRTGTNHVDRYIYGHPKAIFRSLNEYYPHFKHLMDNGGPIGCLCKICTGNSRKRNSVSGSNAESDAPSSRSKYFNQPPKPKVPLFPQPPPRARLPTQAISSKSSETAERLPQGRLAPSPPPELRRKQADEEGTPDMCRLLINQLKQAEEDETIDVMIEERMSPDWRASNTSLKELLDQWQFLPQYVPRVGEVVLFVRAMPHGQRLAWDQTRQTWRPIDASSTWLEHPKWEAGVVTQMLTEEISSSDITATESEKESNVTQSGFRVEPLSEPGSMNKQPTRQHRYVPLSSIRPLAYWKECLVGLNEVDWHPTVRHALTVLNSVCVLGKQRFLGSIDTLTGPHATIFCRGMYAGPELILVGDVVRLSPHTQLQEQDIVTDVLEVTSIKLRLVNINQAGDDDYDEGKPYNVCLHISGKPFTLDPKKSFNGVGKEPIDPDSGILPQGLAAYGQWYYVNDPRSERARREVPFTRVLGRCFESTALEAWFTSPPSVAPPSAGFKAVNEVVKVSTQPTNLYSSLSRALPNLLQARAYSYAHDGRIDKTAGKTWFWADTRIEQLDLHQVNGRDVGIKDESRSREQMNEWRKALKALDGTKGGLEEYHAVRKQRAEQSALPKAASAYGMLGAAVTKPLESEGERGGDEEDEEDEMDEDEDEQNEIENLDAMDIDEDAPPLDAMRASGEIQSIASSDDGDGILQTTSDSPIILPWGSDDES